ncbi:hypothetical protein [Streptococcus pantholopis]|uniref:Uncharacterized protein n=1 Tax=Streptococcus pantholopis TaxID=1811193 RepID=A0A172Q782_9STRE|nr:hypothetical protein [Streptococcus pantholopis]AND79316.1 hypothetical protein A0O21_04375 [Streptococcus pantholopis]
MINTENGTVIFDDNFQLKKGMTFDDFKNSRYYNNQNYKRLFYIYDLKLSRQSFIVGLFFRENKLYSISLILDDRTINQNEEEYRKQLHDRFLKENKINSIKNYRWGTLSSNYDRRSNISSIDIVYT